MGEPENHHFYDFGVLGRVPEPQNHLVLSFETPGYLNKIKKILGTFYVFVNLEVSEIRNSDNVRKDVRRNSTVILLIDS